MAEYIDREAFRKQLIIRQITTVFFDALRRDEIGSPQWKWCPVCGAKMDGGKEK